MGLVTIQYFKCYSGVSFNKSEGSLGHSLMIAFIKNFSESSFRKIYYIASS